LQQPILETILEADLHAASTDYLSGLPLSVKLISGAAAAANSPFQKIDIHEEAQNSKNTAI
jgi:hypothetical protein